MADIPAQHAINVLDVLGWALVDTVRELDHVQRREDITAENFMGTLGSKVLLLDSDAKRLGVDVKFVAELVALLHREVAAPQNPVRTGRANLKLVWDRPEDD